MYDAAAPSAKLLALVQRCSIPYAEVPLAEQLENVRDTCNDRGRQAAASDSAEDADGEAHVFGVRSALRDQRAASQEQTRCDDCRFPLRFVPTGRRSSRQRSESHRGAARDVLSRGSGNSIPSLALASRPMAGADIYDVLRELDADKRFKECRLSVTRPPPLYGATTAFEQSAFTFRLSTIPSSSPKSRDSQSATGSSGSSSSGHSSCVCRTRARGRVAA